MNVPGTLTTAAVQPAAEHEPHPALDCEDPGPAGFTGSLVVAHFDDLAAAQAWAADDPYVHARVYARVTVKPLRKVLP